MGQALVLPEQRRLQVVMEHASYVEQYSDDMRYMHMPMLTQLPSGMFLAIWQAAPLTLEKLSVRASPALLPLRGRLKAAVDRLNPSPLRQATHMLAVEGTDEQHLRLSHSLDKQGTKWTESIKIPIPQKGECSDLLLQAGMRGLLGHGYGLDSWGS